MDTSILNRIRAVVSPGTMPNWRRKALTYCDKPGQLVTITSQGENDFVLGLMTSGWPWIGAREVDTDKNWVWLTGENFDDAVYTNWHGGQNIATTLECMVMMDSGAWNDLPCVWSITSYVVEFGCDPPAYFDFDIAIDDVTISLTNETNFNEAIVFRYNYTGATPTQDSQVNFTYDIFQDDCETDFAPYGNTSMALYFTDFVDEVESNGQVSAKLGINLTLIEKATKVWAQDSSQTDATLSFCGRWNIYVNNVWFQFHESNVTANINLKEDDGFTVNEVSVGLDRKDANALDEAVTVDFPVEVIFCHDNATEADPPADGFTQGDPIQVCLQLETPTDNVFVQSIESFNYSATQVDTTIMLVDGGTLRYSATAEFDCSQVPGVCRVRFIAAAAMFVDMDGNNLFIQGLAVIAFGMDTGRRLRRMQVDSAELVPFEFVVKNLQPNSSGMKSVGAEHGILISVVVGSLVVVIAGGAVAFFLCHRKKRTQAAVQRTGLGRKETVKEDFSSQSGDCYEVVEM